MEGKSQETAAARQECQTGPVVGLKRESILTARTDAIMQAAPDVDHRCISCDGSADMLHIAGEWQVYGTCQHCRDTKDNLVAIVTDRIS